MNIEQHIITIAVAIIAVQLCRWVAFIAFPAHKPIPLFVQYLGQVLPPAVFGLLVVYCYKNVNLFSEHHGLAEFIAGAVTLTLHFWRKNMFLSIAVGTILYMVLVQKIFV